MKLDLRKIQYHENMSEETPCFSCEIWEDDVLIAYCRNDGRGGGDFRGESKLVGSWARDVISVTSKKSDIPKDFQEVLFNLTE